MEQIDSIIEKLLGMMKKVNGITDGGDKLLVEVVGCTKPLSLFCPVEYYNQGSYFLVYSGLGKIDRLEPLGLTMQEMEEYFSNFNKDNCMSKGGGFQPPVNDYRQDYSYVAYATVAAKGITIGDSLRMVETKDDSGNSVYTWYNDSVDPTVALTSAPVIGAVGDAATEATGQKQWRKQLGSVNNFAIGATVVSLAGADTSPTAAANVIDEVSADANLVEIILDSQKGAAAISKDGVDPVGETDPSGVELNAGARLELEGLEEQENAKGIEWKAGDPAEATINYYYVHNGVGNG